MSGTTLRRAAALLGCVGLAVAGLVAVPGVARADGAITTQPYLDQLGVTALHGQGLDGSGVKIALIQSPVDTSVPELQGANIQQIERCQIQATPDHVSLATTQASVLVAPAYGWAPKATLLNYVLPFNSDTKLPGQNMVNGVDQGDCPNTLLSFGFYINLALNDGADVIVMPAANLSAGQVAYARYALVRAADMGVPVLVGAGDSGGAMADNSNALWNSIVTVGATDSTGDPAPFSEQGAGLSLMAWGMPVTFRDADSSGNLTVINPNGNSTGDAVSMVAGALALAKQKWPQANGNQLVRVLMDVADGTADHKGLPMSPTTGGGSLNAPLLVATDPSGYDTTNPFMARIDGQIPTAQDVQAYHDGTADPTNTPGDTSYVYKGCDPAILASPAPTITPTPGMSPGTAPECQTPGASPIPGASPSPAPVEGTGGSTSSLWLPIVIIAAAIVIAAIATVVILRRRRVGSQAPIPQAYPGYATQPGPPPGTYPPQATTGQQPPTWPPTPPTP